MKFDIVGSIVLYENNLMHVSEAIRSFLNSNLKIILVLVDNSPTDQLVCLREIDRERIYYISNPSNPGFGAGHNIAINKFIGQCNYYLVLNPDIYFGGGVLDKIFHFMELNKQYGHLMPKVLYPNGEDQYLCKKNPTVFDLFARRFFPHKIQKIFKKRMDNFEYKDIGYSNIIENVPYLSGCFMFFRSRNLQEIGFFDDRIFMYIEDADITRRMLSVAKNIYYPEVKVYHYFEKGSHKKIKLLLFSIKGAYIYFKKWGLRIW